MPDSWTTIKEWPELRLERLADAGVARILLNRPDKRNCWNRPLCNAFLESLDIIRADQELKACITKGAGPVFSSGLDLTFLREVSNGPLLDWDRPNLTILTYTDANTFVGADPDATIDANDEIVFMAKDTGGRVPSSQPAPADVDVASELEIRVSDPLDARRRPCASPAIAARGSAGIASGSPTVRVGTGRTSTPTGPSVRRGTASAGGSGRAA